MRNFIDIVTQTKPSKRLDEVFDIKPKFDFISQFNKIKIKEDGEIDETSWHQDRRPIDPRDKNGKWNVHDNPPGSPASIMQFGSEAEAKAYVERRKALGTGNHCYVVPPKNMKETSLKAIGEDDDTAPPNEPARNANELNSGSTTSKGNGPLTYSNPVKGSGLPKTPTP